jgi:hypothetical protein
MTDHSPELRERLAAVRAALVLACVTADETGAEAWRDVLVRILEIAQGHTPGGSVLDFRDAAEAKARAMDIGFVTAPELGHLSDAQKHERDCLCSCHEGETAHNSNIGCQRALMEEGAKRLLAVRIEGMDTDPCWSACAVVRDVDPGRELVDGHTAECAKARNYVATVRVGLQSPQPARPSPV